jgi:hypothetical protein
MSPGLWLLHWLFSARALFAVEPDAPLDSARENILGHEFWLLRDPGSGSGSGRGSAEQARNRGAIGYRVLLEVGLEPALPGLLRSVDAVLGDPRGWRAIGREFVRVEQGGRFAVLLARPDTVDQLCAPLRTQGEYSCGRAGRAVLNLARWRDGTPTWGDDVEGYRVYMINHEVGHLLGMPHRRQCAGPGEPAAVMQQQTMTLEGCAAQGWPRPSEIEQLRRLRASWGQ